MRRSLSCIVWLAALITPMAVGAQEAVQGGDGPWWWRMVVFIVSLPYTLYMVFVEGQQMHLLPMPLLGIALCLWSFREWRRQGFWTPRIVHVLAGLGLATIVLINVDWVLAGGEMWTQRYVVIALFGLFPYVVYLVFLGPKFLGKRRSTPEELSSTSSDDAGDWMSGTDHPVGASRAVAARRSRSYALLGALLGIGALGWIMTSGTGGPGSVARPDLAGIVAPELLVPTAGGVAKGDPAAPFTITVFGDYQCPACAWFARRVQPHVDSAFVDTGRARFVFVELPLVSLHANAFPAARAARCAEDQERFWEYQDELYLRQREWSSLTDANGAFEETAAAVGLDSEHFRACLVSDRHTDVIEANQELARRFGIGSTPTIVISRHGGETREMNGRTFQSISRTIEEMEVGGPGA